MANVNRIAKQFGLALINSGTKMIRSAFDIRPTHIECSKLLTEVNRILPGPQTRIADNHYWLLPVDQWKKIIEVDWTDKKTYLKEKFDCDNFAYLFAARQAEIFDINSAGVVYGELFDKYTDKFIDRHYWNIITSIENGEVKFWFYEPMHDHLVEAKQVSPNVSMGKWKYNPLWFQFF